MRIRDWRVSFVFLLLCGLAEFSWASCPLETHDDPVIEREFQNVCQQIQIAIPSTTTIKSSLIQGTTTNDNAKTGYVGEYLESLAIASPVTLPASSHWGDVTSISLTAGDWDVTGRLVYDNGGTATTTNYRIGISTVSGDTTAGMVSGNNNMVKQSGQYLGSLEPMEISNHRVSLAATTTVYLKHQAIYTGAAGSSSGIISTRRIR